MLVVVALGGNALLQRGQAMTIEVQRGNISKAAQALAPMARRHHLVLSHGNGPQVGLLALQQTAYKTVEPYPFDVLDAQTEGMIGYMIEQELGNLLASEVPLATLLTMVEVDSKDLSFRNPTKFIGGQYDEVDAKKMIEANGWAFKKDGDKWRRVVPSPKPKRIYEIRPIKWLLEKGTIVICAGGGGIPIVCEPSEERCMKGIEAVIDKDLASGLLARELKADLFMMVTDVPGVYLNFNKPEAVLLRYTTPSELRRNMYQFPDGSMGPKVQAACEFVEATGNPAAIGALPEINEILNRAAGTIVELDK